MRKSFFILFLIFPVYLFSQNLDIDVLRNINLNRDRQLDGFFRVITDSASPVAYGVAIILIGISFLQNYSHTRKRSLYIGASVVSAGIITTILKYSIQRPRPFITYPFLEKVTSGGSPSFPSGHTTDAFSIATAVSLAYPKWYVIIPAYAWAGAVGFTRMDLGVHYPSDVLVAAIIGTSTAFLCYKALQLNSKNEVK
ncbi:phosphatase PAP2 family protein [Flavobacterium sp. UBA6031]|uniref:phosphatase PAP2 family protein n=1 Tax=Flavobacterium sp. UBA6031 TaxID=1946551 RepID=UPI0025BC9769|nr:phosphatase PAP2 family protein [Flavobacterium sp. UBA6031]